MPRSAIRIGVVIALVAGCATRSKAPAVPTAPAPDVNCAADLAVVENGTSRMRFLVENRSESGKSGEIRQIRLLFTTARCPLVVEGPAGWSGSIDSKAGERACEVAWVSDHGSGIPARTSKDGFVALFGTRRTENPSWGVFFDKCAVSGPRGSTPAK